MLLTILTFSISTVGNSQVKDKFRDRDNSSTIVVIKEDQAIDTELLDQHFDLSQMSMNDQIMITTKPEQSSIPEATPTSDNNSIPEAPVFEESTASIDEVELFFEELEAEKEVDKKEISTLEEKVETTKSTSIATSKVNSAPKRAKSNYPSKSGYEVQKAAQKKYYSKNKIKKRKRNNKRRKWFGKKKSGSCYSF